MASMWSLLTLLAVVASASAYSYSRCGYSCSYRQRYYVSCGWMSWSRCARYRTVPRTCYKYCLHGGWSTWSRWTPMGRCSASCGGGTLTETKTRSCTRPRPWNGGRSCYGESRETRTTTCNTNPCPIDGNWTPFSQWTPVDECPVLCGGGKADLTRSRSCTQPVPQYGGKECVGEDSQIQKMGDCNTQTCAAHCNAESPRKLKHTEKATHFYQCQPNDEVATLEMCPRHSHYLHVAQECISVPCDLNDGLYQPVPGDCRQYSMCLAGVQLIDLVCPIGLVFNAHTQKCDTNENTVVCGV